MCVCFTTMELDNVAFISFRFSSAYILPSLSSFLVFHLTVTLPCASARTHTQQHNNTHTHTRARTNRVRILSRSSLSILFLCRVMLYVAIVRAHLFLKQRTSQSPADISRSPAFIWHSSDITWV